MNLIPNVKITKLTDGNATAGTSTVNGGIVDMQGWDGVVFFSVFGTANAANVLKVQQGQQSNLSDAADLAGSGQSSGASDEVVAVEIAKPLERYVRPVLVRGASTAHGEIWAMQYQGRSMPQSNAVVGTQAAKVLASPAEGTA